jgi:molybdopterin converting factor small subunit
MGVKVRVSSLLRKFTNWQEVVEVAGHSATECLHNLEVQFPDIRQWLYDKQGNLLPQVQFYVNGERILVDELANPLEDDDDLLILLAIGGG